LPEENATSSADLPLGDFVKRTFDSLLVAARIYQLGDIASIFGLVVTIFGFLFTLVGVWKSKSAAEAAELAAQNVEEELRQMNAIQGLSLAIKSLEEIKALHRLPAWTVLPSRYTSLKLDLIAIRGRAPNLTESQKASIQGVITQLSTIEGQVESKLAGSDAPGAAQLNEVVSEQIEKIAVVLVELQAEVERIGQ
jgi:hypothetical protein